MGAYLCIASNKIPPSVSKRITLIVECEFCKTQNKQQNFLLFFFSRFFLTFLSLHNSWKIWHRQAWRLFLWGEVVYRNWFVGRFKTFSSSSSANDVHPKPADWSSSGHWGEGYLGKGPTTKSDEFLEKLERGKGGVIFNPKIYVADFGNFKQGFLSMKLIQKSNFRVLSTII